MNRLACSVEQQLLPAEFIFSGKEDFETHRLVQLARSSLHE